MSPSRDTVHCQRRQMRQRASRRGALNKPIIHAPTGILSSSSRQPCRAAPARSVRALQMGGESPSKSPSHPRADSIPAALSSTRLRGASSPCSAETTLETRSSRGPRAHSTESRSAFRSVSSWKETLRRRRHRGSCPEKHPESHERASDSDLVGSRIVWRFSKQGGSIRAEELVF